MPMLYEFAHLCQNKPEATHSPTKPAYRKKAVADFQGTETDS